MAWGWWEGLGREHDDIAPQQGGGHLELLLKVGVAGWCIVGRVPAVLLLALKTE